MQALEIISKKRDGLKLSEQEVKFMVEEYLSGNIFDYQMSAFLMAICIRGMDLSETTELTKSIVTSGKKLDLTSVPGVCVDKHSTGGVGDKTTLVLAPLIASSGLFMAKLSGRGLGHTGGTLDKLESIPGFRVGLSEKDFLAQVKRVGVAITSASKDLAPADKKIYALRDVTGTVKSIPLIASSVMGKKVAGGAKKIILDVKVDSGAFMKNLEEAEELARIMIKIGQILGVEARAVVSNMDEPLGFAIGNSLEVKEAVDTLKGNGPADLTELCLTLGSYLLEMAGSTSSLEDGKKILEESLSSGKALKKFAQMVEAQGGNPEVISNPDLLPQAKHVVRYQAKKEGYIESIDTEKIGSILVNLGGGRTEKDENIDLSVGMVFRRKCNDRVKRNDTILEIHTNDLKKADEANTVLDHAIQISSSKLPPKHLIHRIIA